VKDVRNASIEVVDVVQAPIAAVLRGRCIDRPLAGVVGDSFEIVGWVIPKAGSVRSVHIVADGEIVAETELNHLRRDLATAFPDVPRAERFGFRTSVEVRRLPAGGELRVEALFEDGSLVPFGAVRFQATTNVSGAGTWSHPTATPAPASGAPKTRSRRRRPWRNG
jgi:hypothetical protein